MKTIWNSKNDVLSTQNVVLLCTKRRGVSLPQFLPLSPRWEKPRTDASTEPKNTVLFYLFCKFHLSNLVYKT